MSIPILLLQKTWFESEFITKFHKDIISNPDYTSHIFQISITTKHSHELNEIEYISAVYRGEMFTAAEKNLEEGYVQLHTEVLKSMRCVFYLRKCSQKSWFAKMTILD